ncbi:DUF7344 domain-containing protein [Natronorubrum halophilum]|uniref:DUF7344 domain-containing protein n=1 Tax=Natronorubrum halophilum TaxID=1702106 RepID=UPI000EF6ABA9|nr:hypothetical protein [Natronorubrum halophilum]
MSQPHLSIDVDRFTQRTGLAVETAYALLASSHTRLTLRALSRCEPPVTLDRLAAAVAQLDAELRRSAARILLVHVTLPKLEEYGVLEYELRSNGLQLEGPVVGLDEPLGAGPELRDPAEWIEPQDSVD